MNKTKDHFYVFYMCGRSDSKVKAVWHEGIFQITVLGSTFQRHQELDHVTFDDDLGLGYCKEVKIMWTT